MFLNASKSFLVFIIFLLRSGFNTNFNFKYFIALLYFAFLFCLLRLCLVQILIFKSFIKFISFLFRVNN